MMNLSKHAVISRSPSCNLCHDKKGQKCQVTIVVNVVRSLVGFSLRPNIITYLMGSAISTNASAALLHMRKVTTFVKGPLLCCILVKMLTA